MRKFAEIYYNNLRTLINSIQVTNGNGVKLNFYAGIEDAAKLIMTQINSGYKLMFIGNGASASISSHMATDFLKNGRMHATAFNDSSLLTCFSNDYGYKHVFEKPIEMIAKSGDILIALSSSGKSENILLGIKSARLKGSKVITLSGFDNNNPLSDQGDYNFFVCSNSYGPVEILHHSICHCLLDTILKHQNK